MSSAVNKDLLERRYTLSQLLGFDRAAEQEGITKESIRRSCRAYKQHFLNGKSDAKVLLLDIENAPSLAYIWSLWKEPGSFKFVDQDWYIMSWAAKWLGGDEVVVRALPDYKGYKKNPTDDKRLLEDLWGYLDAADVIIAHNGKRFDVRKINARFVSNGMTPPSPYKVIDTLLEARANFKFTANDLDSLGKILGVGRKVDTGGFDLWKSCMAGDLEAWEKMKTYNAQDVQLLEDVYLALRPYMKYHPNFGIYAEDEVPMCPYCGSSSVRASGSTSTDVSKFRKYVCQDCGAWSRGRENLIGKDKRKSLITKIS